LPPSGFFGARAARFAAFPEVLRAPLPLVGLLGARAVRFAAFREVLEPPFRAAG
jgi:hypothetical protein